MKPVECLILAPPEQVDRQLGDMIADGRLSEHDADAVRMFAEFLQECGGPKAQRTVEQAENLIQWLSDPTRRDYLGFTEKEAAKAITAIRKRIEQGGYTCPTD